MDRLVQTLSHVHNYHRHRVCVRESERDRERDRGREWFLKIDFRAPSNVHAKKANNFASTNRRLACVHLHPYK